MGIIAAKISISSCFKKIKDGCVFDPMSIFVLRESINLDDAKLPIALKTFLNNLASKEPVVAN
jgi:hypothetical protein